MTLEERVRRLELWAIGEMSDPGFRDAIRRDLAAESEPRDEFQRSAERDAVVDGLRAQVADLTAAKEEYRSQRDAAMYDRDAALARAEKAEREASQMESRWDKAEVACSSYSAECDSLRADLAARDATIAEARWLLDRDRQGADDLGEWTRRRDAWLAGQPTDDPAAESTATTIQYQRRKIEGLRAKVARLEGLRARCEAWLDGFAGHCESQGCVCNAADLLRDLRAGRAG